MCLSKGASVVSIKKERIKNTFFKQYKQKYLKLCLSTGASIVNIKKERIKNTLFKQYKQKY